jgi:NAD(P)-dependent dehydrogenase (short-subunit alcohol dehydrogenase family)/thioesterase domain-containing protein
LVQAGEVRGLADELGVSEAAPLGDVVPALSAWRARRAEQELVDGWRYGVVWKPVEEPALVPLRGRWLLVGGEEQGGDVALMSAALVGQGAEVEVLRWGQGEWDRYSLARHLAGLEAVTGVVALVAGDSRPTAEYESVSWGAVATLTLVQALGDAGVEAPVWCLTRGGVSVDSVEAVENPGQALVWGLGQAVALEQPRRWGGLVDLPVHLNSSVLSRLGVILGRASGEDQVAVRASGLYARRLVPVSGDRKTSPTWSPEDTVLITGGTGVLGSHCAKWMAEHGAGRLVLLSRRGPDAPGARDLEEDLLTRGCDVKIIACDISDRSALEEVLSTIQPEHPLRTIVHAAGINEFKAITDLTLAEFVAVVDGKVTGAVHLDELTSTLDIAAFVLFSSAAGVWGGSHQGSYAAANAFLDALAEYRRQYGRPATSIAWGPWAGEGMAAGPVSDRLTSIGLIPMQPNQALTALSRAVSHDQPCVTIADVDWDSFVETYTMLRPSPFLDDIARKSPERTLASPAPTSDIRRQLADLPAEQQLIALQDLIMKEAASILGHTDLNAVTPQRPFHELGFDSLATVKLRNRLIRLTEIEFQASAVYENDSGEALGRYLLALMEDTGPTVGGRDGHASESGSLESLSDVYREIALLGRMSEAEDLAVGAARLRSVEEDASVLRQWIRPLQLTVGEEVPSIFCFPPFAPVEGAIQFARFAGHFTGRRNVSVLSLPGFVVGEPLAGSHEVLVEALARAVMESAREKPLALLGYSSSSWIAQPVARVLEEAGAQVDALVLLDPYLPDSMSLSFRRAMNYEVLVRRGAFVKMDFTQLTALATYRKMHRSWEPTPVVAPTLVIRPDECIPGPPEEPVCELNWRAHWPLPHIQVNVPGDHCTMMGELSPQAAAAIEEWLLTNIG